MNINMIDDDYASAEELETNLLKSLKNLQTQSENKSFTLSIKDKANSLIGGVTGSTSYGWLLIKILWVAKPYQNKGLGRTLMQRIEGKAKEIGCHGAWLDTSNPQAMNFYKNLGYETFGQLSNQQGNYPPNHNRWFMKKNLEG